MEPVIVMQLMIALRIVQVNGVEPLNLTSVVSVVETAAPVLIVLAHQMVMQS